MRGYSVMPKAVGRAAGNGGATAEMGRVDAMNGGAASSANSACKCGVIAIYAASDLSAPRSVQAPRVEVSRHSSM